MTTAARRPTRVTSAAKVRPSLSRERIAATALRLTEDEPTTPLTLSRLGAELGADPTAIYRHYRNREELLLDVFEHAYGEVLARYRPGNDWRSSLTMMATTTRSVLLKRPALVAEVGYRFTGGPREAEAIAITHRLVVAAGLGPEDALQHVRVYGEMMLAHVMMSAASISSSPDVQRLELAHGARLYGYDPATVRSYEDDTFAQMLATYLTGLAAMATAGSTTGNRSVSGSGGRS
jgi:AcrR family transcriptional regulator